jgi:hypothetical protein
MMGIPLRHGWRFMSEKPLDFVEIHSSLDKPCRKRVPQIMEMEILNLGGFESRIEGSSKITAI